MILIPSKMNALPLFILALELQPESDVIKWVRTIPRSFQRGSLVTPQLTFAAAPSLRLYFDSVLVPEAQPSS